MVGQKLSRLSGFIASTVLCAFAVQAAAAQLLAGAGKVEITPDTADFPMPSFEGAFTGNHDSVFARAIALDDGHHRIVLVNLEVTAIPDGSSIAKAVSDALGLAQDHIVVFASHTHSNPLVFYHGDHGAKATPAQQRMIDRTRDGAVAAAQAAVAALTPARIAFARGEAFVNENNGEVSGTPGVGFSDKTLTVIRLESATGTPLALMINYATHGEVMFHSATKDGGYETSGDLPGATMRLLETTGSAPIVLWAPAAEGDQRSLFRSREPASGALPAVDEGVAGWALVDMQARNIASAVLGTLKKMPAATGDATVAIGSTGVTCPGQRYNYDLKTRSFSLAPSAPDTTIPLTYLGIGNIALAIVAGDLGSIIGQQIKDALPNRQTMVVTMSSDAIGYILPDDAYVNPGHGVQASQLKSGCASPGLVSAFRKLDAAEPAHRP